jgi:hypothetical protein
MGLAMVDVRHVDRGFLTVWSYDTRDLVEADSDFRERGTVPGQG